MTLCMSHFSVLLIRNKYYVNYYLVILLRISVFIFLFTSRTVCIGISFENVNKQVIIKKKKSIVPALRAVNTLVTEG